MNAVASARGELGTWSSHMRHPQQKCIVGGNARNGMWRGKLAAEASEAECCNIATPHVNSPWRIDVVCLKDDGVSYIQHGTYLQMRRSNENTINLKASCTLAVNRCY